MAAIQLILYSRPGCHLCAEMKQIAQPVAAAFTCELLEVDISQDATLEARFGHEVPVLMINGRKAFKYRLSARELRQRLQHERAPSSL